MLIGNVPMTWAQEEELFALLCHIEANCVITKQDELGCSKNTQFKIDLTMEDCKPVCHALRKCGATKQEFIDDTVDKMLTLGMVECRLDEW